MSIEARRIRLPALHQPAGPLVLSGAELVHVVEDLYLRLFRLVLLFTLAGAGLSVWFGGLSSHNPPEWPTLAIAAVAAGAALSSLAWPRKAYCWLRYDRARQLAPAAFAASAVLLNGPDSSSWWVALPLLWITAAVGSTGLTVAASIATAVAYAAGTLLGGEALIHSGEAGVLAAAVGLVANTMVGKLAAEVFARFVLRLHRLQCEQDEQQQPPRQVVALQPAEAFHYREDPVPRSPTNPRRQPARGVSVLTARQLEVALLTRDGLRQAEIAVCLGISPRQVERLLHEARARAGAATTSELVSMLVTGRLVPAP
jgi:DNA-binding CsgD family transcriptional regulator